MKPITELMYIKVRRDIHSFAEVTGLFNTARHLGYRVAKGVVRGSTYGGYVIDHKEKVIRGIATPHTFYTCNHREATTYEAITSIRHHAQEKNMEPRPHAELIKAWAEGAEIQVKSCGDGGYVWTDLTIPGWHKDNEYRIKPETKVYYAVVEQRHRPACPTISFISLAQDDGRIPVGYFHNNINLKLVMDDEGNLISAEAI